MKRRPSEPAWKVRGLDRLPALPGEILANRYRIERVLGAGGMGIVLAARDLETRKRVALKLPNPAETTRADLVRFGNEAEILSSLSSPQVPRLESRGECGGLPYFCMEYVEGRTLSELLDCAGQLSTDAVVRWLLDLCAVLKRVHAAGVVHRDVKLENLMSRSDRERPLLTLLDFGIAKRLGAPSIEPSDFRAGSPRYMSPEQLTPDAELDQRVDIWSAGIVAFELLTGDHPFEGASLEELARAIAEDEAPSLRDHRRDVSPELAAAITRCLEKDRARRFQSAAELAAALLDSVDLGLPLAS
ncbi:MAG: serine/threonine-protein kinase [Polyangiaceae bacterium]